mgnify:CR=1 FL=1
MTGILAGGVRGLTLVKTLVQIAAYGVVMWTYAENAGLGDAFRRGVHALVGLPAQLVGQATPGGGRA